MLSLALVRLCEFQVIARQLQESSCGAAIAGSFREAGQGVRLSVVIVIAWHDLSPIYSRDVLNSLQLDSFLKKWHFPRNFRVVNRGLRDADLTRTALAAARRAARTTARSVVPGGGAGDERHRSSATSRSRNAKGQRPCGVRVHGVVQRTRGSACNHDLGRRR
jgi:hypothetical protein